MLSTTTSATALLSLFLLHLAPVSGSQPHFSSCSLDSFSLHPDNGSGIWPYRSYQSSNVTPPSFLISQSNQSLSPGLLFFTPQNSGSTPGENQEHPLISTSQGDLVWAGPEAQTNNLRKQQLHGRPVLTYWIGSGSAASAGAAGHGYGQVEVLDSSYKTIHTICPKINITLPLGTTVDCAADIHESYITAQNTMLVTAYNITQADLTSVGGPKDGWVYDPLAVEVDIDTNEAIFVWDPLAHVPVNASRFPLGGSGRSIANPYDWFHMNSIQSFNGGYLINARHTWTTYFVNRSGEIEWQINGDTGGDFGEIPPEAKFSWQHDARVFNHRNDNQLLLTYFANDNDAPLASMNASAGLGLLLDFPPSKSKSPEIYSHIVDKADPVISYAEGDYQILPDGNQFIGYGIRPVLKEFGPDGAPKLPDVQATWHATPSTPLDLVVLKSASHDGLTSCAKGSSWRGYVSWNGATDVREYAVYAGSAATNLTQIATVAKNGFETAFVVPEDAKFVQVAAVENKQRGECGKSGVVAVQ